MATLNHCFIIGNLTRDPELRYTKNGTMLCAFAIGTTRYYEANGARKQETSFIDCKAWAEVAQRASELSKGSKVIIEGRLEQERWQGDDGVQRSRLVVIADRVVAVA